MLGEKMYVRCPADIESATDPRVFVCGQVVRTDEFKRTVTVKVHDPFNYRMFFSDLPKGVIEFPEDSVVRCSLFVGTDVVYAGRVCQITAEKKGDDGYYYYYVQDIQSKEVFRVSEKEIIASLTNGKVDPSVQLKNYELQNPCWFLGHAVVSRSMNILDNSIYGFKELAGSKIYLLPHQINTIMRCLQESPCRYMLADEVGMGKTIEAVSVMKIFMQSRANQNALIIVPETLKEQWKSELLLKFNIPLGSGKNNNSIIVKSISELSNADCKASWDFVIVDEVHRYLQIKDYYRFLHSISSNAKNILLLSATPVQQRKEEYLDLLRLLQPEKYDGYSIDRFGDLIEKQGRIIQKTALVLDDLSDFEEEYQNVLADNKDPHGSEDCEELFDEIHDDLEDICDSLNDPKLDQLLEEIKYEDPDLGIYKTKVLISYICSNYQIENSIIRNRRKILENSDSGERLLPTRELMSVKYELNEEKNTYESYCYQLLTDWLNRDDQQVDIDTVVRPLMGAFFSSPWAFNAVLKKLVKKTEIEDLRIQTNAENWEQFENEILGNISDILDDPDKYEEYYSTRIMSVINLLYEELYEEKIVLFTNYEETFSAYRSVLKKVFGEEELSFFGADMSAAEIELNAFRFQNEKACRIMLCDYTGGEGRNFQCADYIVHIDLPWDANIIEQRIGRLDRLERDMSRPVVNSVVVHTEGTFEEALFSFWNEGLKIFNQSLSGMEIIMKDINQEIISAVKSDFKFGLFDRIPTIIKLADDMRETVRKEQNYDAASFIFRPMYAELKRLTDYYAQNENELFADTMTNWASLAGFRGFSNKAGVLTYTAASFSPKSAINSQLIPPRWNDYLSSEQNKFLNGVQEAYNKSKSIKNQDRSIKGTFIRKVAIENDYLHFFAPGDEIFDCIVNNAMNSCKGCSSAFVTPAGINWRGLIFTWSLMPDESYLLDKGVSIYALSPYRSYLMSEQVIIPISIDNKESHSDSSIVREYLQVINSGFKKERTIHLGKRSREARYLKEIITGTNIDWFKKQYPEENWIELIESSRKAAYEKAFEQFKHRSNIRGAKEEMERTLSARVANGEFYGIDDEQIEELKREQEIILEAIRRPRISLDSAAFVWMVKVSNG